MVPVRVNPVGRWHKVPVDLVYEEGSGWVVKASRRLEVTTEDGSPVLVKIKGSLHVVGVPSIRWRPYPNDQILFAVSRIYSWTVGGPWWRRSLTSIRER